MKKTHWRDLGFFVAGTFLGGYVLGFLGGILGGKKG